MKELQKIAQIDSDSTTTTIRYQLSDHLGSASLELDENADIISYEEYYTPLPQVIDWLLVRAKSSHQQGKLF